MIAKNKVVLLLTVAVVFIQFGCNKNADLDAFKPPIPDQSELQNIPLNDPDEFVFEGLNSGLFPWGNPPNSGTWGRPGSCPRASPSFSTRRKAWRRK